MQQFFARQRDLVARELQPEVRCLLAFKHLGTNPVYPPRWSSEVQMDLFDTSPPNKPRIRNFIRDNRVVLVVFQGAQTGEIDIGFFRRLGVRTMTTEDYGFDHTRTQPRLIRMAKFVLRDLLKYQLHDRHIVNTTGQYAFLRRFACLPRQRLRIVPHGIDIQRFRPGDRARACTRSGWIQTWCGSWLLRSRARKSA